MSRDSMPGVVVGFGIGTLVWGTYIWRQLPKRLVEAGYVLVHKSRVKSEQ